MHEIMQRPKDLIGIWGLSLSQDWAIYFKLDRRKFNN